MTPQQTAKEINRELRRTGGAMTLEEVVDFSSEITDVANGLSEPFEVAGSICEARRERNQVLARVQPEKSEVSRVVEEESERARQWAVSVRAAERAAEGVDVRAFRAAYLQGGLVDWADLEGWLHERPEPIVVVAKVWMDPEVAHSAMEQQAWPHYTMRPIRGMVRGLGHSRLPVQRPDGSLASVPLRAGPIAEGFSIAEKLASGSATPWDQRQAFVWLFTGVTPLLSLMTTETWTFEGQPPWRVRIEVDADVDPAEVESAFRVARQRGTKRARTMAPKAWNAAAWRLRHPGRPWPELMRSFNRAHPADAFSDLRQFRRMVGRATARLPLATDRTGSSKEG